MYVCVCVFERQRERVVIYSTISVRQFQCVVQPHATVRLVGAMQHGFSSNLQPDESTGGGLAAGGPELRVMMVALCVAVSRE